MSARVAVFVAGPITLVTTAETVVATLPPFSVVNLSGEGIKISGVVNLLGGTANTNILTRVRRGDIGGVVVGNGAANDSVGAGTVRSIPFEVQDTDTFSGSTTYVLTIQQVTASGNGTVNRVSFGAEPQSSLS